MLKLKGEFLNYGEQKKVEIPPKYAKIGTIIFPDKIPTEVNLSHVPTKDLLMNSEFRMVHSTLAEMKKSDDFFLSMRVLG